MQTPPHLSEYLCGYNNYALSVTETNSNSFVIPQGDTFLLQLPRIGNDEGGRGRNGD